MCLSIAAPSPDATLGNSWASTRGVPCGLRLRECPPVLTNLVKEVSDGCRVLSTGTGSLGDQKCQTESAAVQKRVSTVQLIFAYYAYSAERPCLRAHSVPL